jgi:hypothetical protein
MTFGLMSPVLIILPAASGGPSLRLTPPTGPAGATISVSGQGFAARTRVVFGWDGVLTDIQATTSKSGTFDTQLVVPAAYSAGTHAVGAWAVPRSSNGRAAAKRGAPAPTTLASVDFVVSPATPTPVPSATSLASPPATPSPSLLPSPSLAPTSTPAPSSSPVGSASPSPSSPPQDNCTRTVSDGQSVQAAIDAAAPGATICLAPGTYSGFDVTKALTIRGDAMIRGPRTHVVRVTASGVVLDGLEVTGGSTQYGAGVRFVGVSSGVLRNCFVHDNLSYDVDVTDSTGVTIQDCLLSRAGAGVWVNRSTGVTIERNSIKNIDVETRNDAEPGNDYGGQCVSLNNFAGMVRVRDNLLHTCRANSIDYGVDGTAIEIWQASGFEITGNVIYDTVNAFETGTHGPEGSFVFARNVVYDAGPAILRTAPGALIEHNTFDGLGDAALQLSHHQDGQFSGSIAGLVIRSNIFSNGPSKALRFDTALPTSVVIDWNDYWANSRIDWDDPTFAEFRARYPAYELHGLAISPAYVGRSTHVYDLANSSDLIGRAHDGTNIGSY